MRGITAVAVTLAACLAACAARPPALNSERIAAQFGSYGIEIVAFDDGVRHANLYSTHGDARICRTYAVVRFNAAAKDLAESQHARVLDGESIGATFKASGWQVLKQTRYIGEITLDSDEHTVRRLMRLTDDAALAMHVYRLNVRKNSQLIDYATIIEVHHPDYLRYGNLQELFPPAARAAASDEELLGWRSLVLNVSK